MSSRLDKLWDRIYGKVPVNKYVQPTPHNIQEKGMMQQIGDFVKSKIFTINRLFQRWCMSSSTPFSGKASEFRYGHDMSIDFVKADTLSEKRQPDSRSMNY